jgi:transposase-like protein
VLNVCPLEDMASHDNVQQIQSTFLLGEDESTISNWVLEMLEEMTNQANKRKRRSFVNSKLLARSTEAAFQVRS